MKNVPIGMIFVDAYFQVTDKLARSCKKYLIVILSTMKLSKVW